MLPIRITSLFYYPIKSCAGTSADTVTLDAQGIRFDRRWMLVEAVSGQFLTQREYPAMARIQPTATEDGLSVSAPGREPLDVPTLPEEALARRVVTVWRFTGEALDEGDDAAVWFSDCLGMNVRLVRTPDDFTRRVNPDAGKTEGFPDARPDARLGFADGYPLLLASESSLADLNARLLAPVPMNRFRPNVVIAGAEAFAEDGWRTLTTESGVPFRVAKPCARCAIPTVDQATGEKTGKEPLATLTAYRRAADGGVHFAMNLIHDQVGAPLRVGETLTAAP